MTIFFYIYFQIGENMHLRRFRKLNKIKMEDFAKQLDSSPSTISKIENADSFPRPELMNKILLITKGQVTPNDFVEKWIASN